jgi:hypothetical protein
MTGRLAIVFLTSLQVLGKASISAQKPAKARQSVLALTPTR